MYVRVTACACQSEGVSKSVCVFATWRVCMRVCACMCVCLCIHCVCVCVCVLRDLF